MYFILKILSASHKQTQSDGKTICIAWPGGLTWARPEWQTTITNCLCAQFTHTNIYLQIPSDWQQPWLGTVSVNISSPQHGTRSHCSLSWNVHQLEIEIELFIVKNRIGVFFIALGYQIAKIISSFWQLWEPRTFKYI
jgi:hypothetical protein